MIKKQACEKLEAEIKLLKSELEKEKKRSNLEIVQRSWMKFSVAKGHQTTRLVWDTSKTQLLHHKDLSKDQLVMQML